MAKENGTVDDSVFTVSEQLKGILGLLEKSVQLKETRSLFARLLRQTAIVRKHLTAHALATFVANSIPSASPSRGFILGFVEQDSMVDDGVPQKEQQTVLPEVEMYCFLLTLIYLIDAKKYSQARDVAVRAVQRLGDFNRRTLDLIAARIYFYYSLAHEHTDSLSQTRSTLLGLHRTAVLRHDIIGQETLLNLVLRNYLHHDLYDQAEKFRSKAQKADSFSSSQQFCRYLFYLGKIRTIQLEYTDAKDNLQQAARKAPASARGFRVAAAKWLTLVRLLLGEVPERTEFSVPGLAVPLQPYLELSAAVRSGDLSEFRSVVAKYDAVFRADKTRNLITRLHHNVIRTGLRRINLAYSRISLADIAEKLGLSSVEDAEHIVAKAIRDGGIEATIDHEGGFIRSQEVSDVYSSSEPARAFHARIAFCLDIHNEAVKAMRFEPDAHKQRLETADARKERILQEQEIADAMTDGDDL